ncbi:MAG: glycosyltransferase [Planctomycetia bacterium]|nr:glycosyltransferase [Planctomycetia bacterium]
MTAGPRVSVCVPTWQGAAFVAASVGSALAQDVDGLEVVVSDDGSTDGTLDVVASLRDPRVRVVTGRRLGLPGNWDRALRAARAPALLLLGQDDHLEPGGLARLLAALDARPDAAFAYGRRRVLVDAGPDGAPDADLHRLAADVEGAQDLLGPPPPFRPAFGLLEAWAATKALANPVGEPSVVLMRRAALRRAGLFSRRLVQLVDIEMWARLAAVGGVAFVDAVVATFRVHAASATRRHAATGRDALDRLWLLEGLLEDPAIASAWPALRKWRRHEARRVVRRIVDGTLGTSPRPGRHAAKGLREWLWWRALRPFGRAPRLHASYGRSG